MRGVPNHHIDDDSLKEYFYRGEVDRNKEMLDTIMGTSYGEYTYAEIVEKLEKISHNNKMALERWTLGETLRSTRYKQIKCK